MVLQRVGVFLSIGVLLLSASAVEATVLTMEGDVSSPPNPSPPPAGGATYAPWGNGSTVVSEYGDYVAGPTQTDVPTADFLPEVYWYNFYYGNNGEGYTPNVNVGKQIIYGPVTNTATRSYAGYGNLTKIAYPSTSSTIGGSWYWTFTADPGYLVNLISADLVRASSTVYDATVNVYAGDVPTSLGPLLYTSGAVGVNNVAQTFAPNVTGSALTLEIVIPPVDAIWNWGIDNIVFSQTAVPEPTSLGLLGIGVVSAMLVRRGNRH